MQLVAERSHFQIHLSVPLVLEYEEVAKRSARSLGLAHEDIDNVIDFLCSIGERHSIHYLWRPYLPDQHDDMLLELAVTANCSHIITYNIRDFIGIEKFGVQATTPQLALREAEKRS